eukprot:gene18289-24907_t
MPKALRGDVATGFGWRNAGYAANDYEYIGQVAPAGELVHVGSADGTAVGQRGEAAVDGLAQRP